MKQNPTESNEFKIWVALLAAIILIIAALTSCSCEENLTQPSFYQSKTIKIDTISCFVIRDWKIKREYQLELTQRNTQGFEWLRYESVDSVRFVGEWSY